VHRVESEALLLRKVAYGESDVVATFLTEHAGKVSAIARGGRRSFKRFGGALEPFHTTHLVLEDRGRELRTLHEARVVRLRNGLLGSLDAMDASGVALRWARHLLPARTPEPEAWAILTALLDALDAGEGTPRAALAAAGLQLLSAVGYALDFDRCVRCTKPAPAERSAMMDAARGGLVCRACGGAVRRMGGELRAIAREATAGGSPVMTDDDARTLLAIVEDAMAAHTDFDPAGGP
jgi:DNA repair protein RecO (recombination protein O)